MRSFVPKGTRPGVYRGTATIMTTRGNSTVQLSVDGGERDHPGCGEEQLHHGLLELQYGPLSWDEGDGDTIESFYGYKALSPQWWKLMDEFAKSMRRTGTTISR